MMKHTVWNEFEQRKKQGFFNLRKVVGGLRGLALRPFFKRCGLPISIEGNVEFSSLKSTSIGKWVRIRMGTQVLRDVVIEDGVFIGRYCDVGCDTTLEANVTLADRVCILNNTHDFSNPEKRAGEMYSLGKTVIAKGAWIGYGVVILPQVQYVGKGAVIGAGAVVTKDVPDHSIAVGNPARVIRQLSREARCDQNNRREEAPANRPDMLTTA